MTKRIPLKVVGITASELQRGTYALVLSDEEGIGRFPIIIGTSEAQSIAAGMEHLRLSRPLTHDLFVSLIHGFGVQLKEVLICQFEEGVFFSELIFEDDFRRVVIDSRTSDAVALALRLGSPIFATWEVYKKAKESFEEILKAKELHDSQEDKIFSSVGQHELEVQLHQAEQERAYELASRIYRELKKREPGGEKTDENR